MSCPLSLHYAYIVLTADALFAVYEASSLELWFFMYQAALNGGARAVGYITVFYVTLVFFLVFLVQVSLGSVYGILSNKQV